MVEITRPRLDLDQLFRDVCRTAEIFETPCNEETVRAILDAYSPRFLDSTVALRTTDHPVGKRELSVRYVNMTSPEDDPYATALARGFLTPDDHPVYALFADVRANWPALGCGVDSSAQHGMEKIWPFYSEPVPTEAAFRLRSVPESVQRYADYFKKYHLDTFSLFAIDYRNKSMNIYFIFLPAEQGAPHALETVSGMITDLGFALPSAEEMEVNRRAVLVYMTFRWDTPRCIRTSFVIPHGPIAEFPAHLSPFIAQILDKVPTLSDPTIAGMQTAYPLDKPNYHKVEFDYTGTMVQSLRRAVLGV